MTVTAPPRTADLFTIQSLPDSSLVELGQRIFLDPDQRKRLRKNLMLYRWMADKNISQSALALRQAVLISGAPGTGKTSIAMVTANEMMLFQEELGWLATINAHAIPGGEKGQTQKRVGELFTKIGELASTGRPTFLILNEVESLATDRSSFNPDANPLDTLYGVNAFIEGLDHLVERHSNVVLIMTSNLPRFIDKAVDERVDFREEIELPDAKLRRLILADAIAEIGRALTVTPVQDAEWEIVLAATEGMSPRVLRHLVTVALVLAMGEDGSLSQLTLAHVSEAAHLHRERLRRLNEIEGVYGHEYQRRPRG